MPTARYGDKYVGIAAFILLVGNTILCASRKTIEIKFDKVLLWYCAIVAYGIMSCIWSNSTEMLELYITNIFPMVLGATLCISSYINSDEDLDTVFKMMIMAGCIAAIRFCYYTPWSIIFSSNSYIRGTFGSLIDDVTNYNNYTTHLAIICLIAAYYAVIRGKKWCWLSFGFLSAVVVVGGSRKNFIVIPLIILFYSLCQGNVKKKIKSMALVIFIITLGLYALVNIEILSQIKTKSFEMVAGLFSNSNNMSQVDESTIERLYLQFTALNVWTDHPLLGVGFNNFIHYNYLKITAHNNYLEILASLGIIGLIIYYSKYFASIVGCQKEILKGNVNSMNIMVMGVLLGYMLQEYGAVIVYSRERMIILILVFVAYSVTNKRKRYKLLNLK